MTRKPKDKAPRGRGVEDRREAWIQRYLTNGNNATEAAVHAGYSPDGARLQGHRMLHHPDIIPQLAARAQVVAEAAEMTTVNWAREVRAIAFADPAEMFGVDGALLPVPQMPPRIRAALASVTVDAAGKTTVRLNSKNEALVTMARHLGLFERDNEQLRSDVRVRIELVG